MFVHLPRISILDQNLWWMRGYGTCPPRALLLSKEIQRGGPVADRPFGGARFLLPSELPGPEKACISHGGKIQNSTFSHSPSSLNSFLFCRVLFCEGGQFSLFFRPPSLFLSSFLFIFFIFYSEPETPRDWGLFPRSWSFESKASLGPSLYRLDHPFFSQAPFQRFLLKKCLKKNPGYSTFERNSERRCQITSGGLLCEGSEAGFQPPTLFSLQTMSARPADSWRRSSRTTGFAASNLLSKFLFTS